MIDLLSNFSMVLLICASVALYVSILLIAMFYRSNSLPMKIVRVFSLPVMIIVIMLFCIGAGAIMVGTFVNEGVKAFK